MPGDSHQSWEVSLASSAAILSRSCSCQTRQPSGGGSDVQYSRRHDEGSRWSRSTTTAAGPRTQFVTSGGSTADGRFSSSWPVVSPSTTLKEIEDLRRQRGPESCCSCCSSRGYDRRCAPSSRRWSWTCCIRARWSPTPPGRCGSTARPETGTSPELIAWMPMPWLGEGFSPCSSLATRQHQGHPPGRRDFVAAGDHRAARRPLPPRAPDGARDGAVSARP